MKKAILFLLGLIILSFVTNASDGRKYSLLRQPGDQPHCCDEGTHIINLGIGFGGVRYYYGSLGSGYSYKSSPAFSATYEQAWPKKLGPGFLGIGAYLGYKNSSSRYDYSYWNDDYYYEHRWNYYMVAARGVYHWDVLNAKNAEVYGGVLIGLRVTTYAYETNDTDPFVSRYERKDSGVRPVYSLFAGARWYFVPKVALFAEAGYGISYITGGFSFKF
jgi:hypothetical protein